jgi:hypothetical protein
MANLCRSEVINSKPIGDGLNVFRDSFKSLYEELGISTSVDGLQYIGHERTYSGLYMAFSLTHVDLQNLALDLILALLVLPVSRILPSNIGNKNFFGDLSRLNSAVIVTTSTSNG